MRMTSRVGIWEPGIIRGPDLFPSKEIAEQHALELRIRIKPFAKSWYDHICALPEGEQPG